MNIGCLAMRKAVGRAYVVKWHSFYVDFIHIWSTGFISLWIEKGILFTKKVTHIMTKATSYNILDNFEYLTYVTNTLRF